jgi:hypothetical protein
MADLLVMKNHKTRCHKAALPTRLRATKLKIMYANHHEKRRLAFFCHHIIASIASDCKQKHCLSIKQQNKHKCSCQAPVSQQIATKNTSYLKGQKTKQP